MKRLKLSLLFMISASALTAHAGNFFSDLANSFSSKTSSAAQPSPTPVPQLTTADSSYVEAVNVPADARLVWFQITPDDGQNPYELAYFIIPSGGSSGGHIEEKIYLRHGAGKYTINSFYSLDPNRYQAAAGMKFIDTDHVSNTDTKDESYLLPSGDAESDDPAIIKQAQSLVNAGMDDMAKAKALHDWIASTIQYDAASYFDGSYATKVYDASSVFQSHLSICYGYSNLYAAMARAIGMRTKVINGAIIWPSLGQSWAVQGTTQPHAWNEILVGDRWVTVDTTWDSGNMDFTTKVFTQSLHDTYFDPVPATFALDHQKISDNVSD